jgi:hypothetical protein
VQSYADAEPYSHRTNRRIISMRSHLLVGLTLLIAAGACSRGGGPPGPVPPPVWTPLAIDARLYYDNNGGIQDSVRMVVRDPDALRVVWRQATSRQASPPPLPEVDFRQHMLLVVAAGRRMPDDQLQVDSLGIGRERDSEGRVEETMSAVVRFTEGCGRFQADAYPVDIVRVRRFDGPVRFVERRQSADGCTRN